MHAIITGYSWVISMDLAVCHKEIEEKWRQQIILVAKHEFCNVEGIDLELRCLKFSVWKIEEQYGPVCVR